MFGNRTLLSKGKGMLRLCWYTSNLWTIYVRRTIWAHGQCCYSGLQRPRRGRQAQGLLRLPGFSFSHAFTEICTCTSCLYNLSCIIVKEPPIICSQKRPENSRDRVCSAIAFGLCMRAYRPFRCFLFLVGSMRAFGSNALVHLWCRNSRRTSQISE